MPIYEYECPKCFKCYEFMHKHTETLKGQVYCDICLIQLNKIISIASFRLLGEGFEIGKKPPSDWD